MPCRKAAIGEPEGKRNVILQMRQIATVKISGGKFNVVEKVQIIGIAIIPTTTLLIILVAMILKIIKIAKNITVPCPAKIGLKICVKSALMPVSPPIAEAIVIAVASRIIVGHGTPVLIKSATSAKLLPSFLMINAQIINATTTIPVLPKDFKNTFKPQSGKKPGKNIKNTKAANKAKTCF